MIINVPIKRITSNPWQTRRAGADPEYIAELATDIAANGLLQTPLGRLVDGNEQPVDQDWKDTVMEMKLVEGDGIQVQLAFGHNRLRAYEFLDDRAGGLDTWAHMRVEIRQMTDEQMAVNALSENGKRRDVSAIERAWAIQKCIKDFEWSNRKCGEALGIDHSTVANMLRLLKLPEEIQTAILEGKLSERQAQALLPLYEAPIDMKSPPYIYYGFDSNPPDIIKDALAGSSSDYIRGRVSNYFEAISEDLEKAEFKIDHLLPEEGGIYCRLCSTCDKRMASRNRCFNKLCFEAKTNFIHRKYLEKASFSSGYPILNEHKMGFPSDLPSGWEKEKLEKIIATKCPNLVLQYTHDKSETSLEHFPHARLVCEMRMNSCRCQKGLEALGRMERASTAESAEKTFTTKDTKDFGEEIDHDGMAAAELGIDTPEEKWTPEPIGIIPPDPVMLSPLSAGELEAAAKQARKEAREALTKLQEYSDKLREHLYQEILIQAPGAFWAALRSSLFLYDHDWTAEKAWRFMAHAAARAVLPSEFRSEADLVKKINARLERLNLPPLGSFAEQFQEVESVPEL